MKRHLTATIMLLLMPVLVFGPVACTKKAATPGQTPGDRYRTLVKIGDDIAHGIELGLDLTGQIYTQKLLDADLTATIATGFLDAARISKELHAQLANYSTLDQANARATLIEILNRLAASLDRLALNGTLHIKNEQTKTQLTAALSVVSAALVVAKGIVGGA